MSNKTVCEGCGGLRTGTGLCRKCWIAAKLASRRVCQGCGVTLKNQHALRCARCARVHKTEQMRELRQSREKIASIPLEWNAHAPPLLTRPAIYEPDDPSPSLAAWNVEVATANAMRIGHDLLRLREVLTGTMMDDLKPHEAKLLEAVRVHRRVADDPVALNLAVRRGVQAGGSSQRIDDFVEVATESVTIDVWRRDSQLAREGVG